MTLKKPLTFTIGDGTDSPKGRLHHGTQVTPTKQPFLNNGIIIRLGRLSQNRKNNMPTINKKIQITINLVQMSSIKATIDVHREASATDNEQEQLIIDSIVSKMQESLRDRYPMFLSRDETSVLLGFTTDALDHFLDAGDAVVAGNLAILQRQIQRGLWQPVDP